MQASFHGGGGEILRGQNLKIVSVHEATNLPPFW